MTHELSVSTHPVEFRSEVREMFTTEEGIDFSVDEAVRLCKLGGGVLKFAETVFPGVELSSIMAEKYVREPEGRGAHFDVYDETLDEQYPYLAVFNLSGEAEVTAAKLPDVLADTYFKLFPVPDEDAYQARRDFSSIALKSPNVELYTGSMEAGSGMVLMQRKGGPHIIHNVVPKNRDKPGEFIKLVRTSSDSSAVELVGKTALQPLDSILSEAIGLETAHNSDSTDEVDFIPATSDISRSIATATTSLRPHGRSSFKRPCNLD